MKKSQRTWKILNYVTAQELTTESPQVNNTLLPPLPQRCKCKWQDNEETPRQSLRIKTLLQLRSWFITSCCAEGSCPDIWLSLSWRLFTAASRYCEGEYLAVANSAYNNFYHWGRKKNIRGHSQQRSDSWHPALYHWRRTLHHIPNT